MSEGEDKELIELVTKEQRGFRVILFSGLATLVALVAMSAGMGFYYYDLSKSLAASARTLQLEAFQTRIKLDQQNNRVSAQERRIRRIHQEIRALGGQAAGAVADPRASGAALAAARDYLLDGRLSFGAERLLETYASGGGEPGEQALFRGVVGLSGWLRNGDPIPADATALPDTLAQAGAAFEQAAATPQLAPLAKTGLAWVQFLNASSPRSSFAQADCNAVIALVSAAQPGAQPLYWQAQCERKTGQPLEALRDYAKALEQAASRTGARDEASDTLLMNAYHGFGTTLIAVANAPDTTIAPVLQTATQYCADSAPLSGRMKLAAACLRKAIALRRALGQTQNEVSGSAENLSFALLREQDFQGAFANAQAVKDTGLFPWTELVRALAAAHLNSAQARQAGIEARRNISFFRVEQFNLCELRVLMSEGLYQEAVGIITKEHPGQPAACGAAAS